jgi:hypothetical protein
MSIFLNKTIYVCIRKEYVCMSLFVDGRIIVEWICKKWDGKTWTGLIWFRIGTGGRLL